MGAGRLSGGPDRGSFKMKLGSPVQDQIRWQPLEKVWPRIETGPERGVWTLILQRSWYTVLPQGAGRWEDAAFLTRDMEGGIRLE
jgi:hypothetical protein